mmetsp:Transcript_39699/g.86667  ORF Transcript_39699/g.86667 Transcript_39699/m.86667 type:complete len:202 (-) Transcript_39699:740-1345(-)
MKRSTETQRHDGTREVLDAISLGIQQLQVNVLDSDLWTSVQLNLNCAWNCSNNGVRPEHSSANSVEPCVSDQSTQFDLNAFRKPRKLCDLLAVFTSNGQHRRCRRTGAPARPAPAATAAPTPAPPAASAPAPAPASAPGPAARTTVAVISPPASPAKPTASTVTAGAAVDSVTVTATATSPPATMLATLLATPHLGTGRWR